MQYFMPVSQCATQVTISACRPHREVIAAVIGIQRKRQQMLRRIVEGMARAQHLAAARDQDAVNEVEPAKGHWNIEVAPNMGATALRFAAADRGG